MKYCPSCKGAFEPEHAYCPKDGTRLLRNSRDHSPSLLGRGPTAELGPVRARANPSAPEATSAAGDAEEPEEAEAPDTVLGTVIAGRYFIERRLGEGGMGVVYAGVDQRLEKPVAIKLLREDFARRGDVVARFTQEAKSAARIKHENVLDVTDYGQTEDGSFYITMELLVGADLADALQQSGTIEPDRGVDIAIQICRALGSAHQKGVIHRDMKPENVFLVRQDDGRESVKIVDFGIAQMKDISGASPEGARKLTRTGMIFGTPEYMSPEQAAGKPIDHRVDVYATGVILYEMFAGRVPFLGDSFMGVLTQHMFSAPPSIHEVNPAATLSPDLEAVVLKALAKNPDDRYGSMQELADDLTRVRMGGRPTAPNPAPMSLPDRSSMTAARTSASAPVARPDVVAVSRTVENELTRNSARRTGMLVGGVLAAVVLVVVGAVAFTSGSGGTPGATVATHPEPVPTPAVPQAPPVAHGALPAPTPVTPPTPTPVPPTAAPEGPAAAVQNPPAPVTVHLHLTTGSAVASVHAEGGDGGVSFDCPATPCDETVVRGTALHLVATAPHRHGTLDVTVSADGQAVDVPLVASRPIAAGPREDHATHGGTAGSRHCPGHGHLDSHGQCCGFQNEQGMLVPCW